MCCQLQLLLQSVLFHFYWSFENATSEWPWVCTAKVESSNDFVCSYKFYRKFECAIGLDAIGTPYNIIIVEDVCFNVCLFQEIRNSETPNGFGKVWRVSVYARFVLWLYDSVSLWHCKEIIMAKFWCYVKHESNHSHFSSCSSPLAIPIVSTFRRCCTAPAALVQTA